MTSIFNRRDKYPKNKTKQTKNNLTMYRPKKLMFQDGGPMEQQDQILQMVAQALQQGTPPEQVMQMLIEQGIPQEQAQQMIQMVMSQMQGQMSPQQPTNGQPMMKVGGMRPKGLSYDYQ